MARANVSITDKRKDWDKFVKNYKTSSKKKSVATRIGLFGKKSSEIVQIGTQHEFGVGFWEPQEDNDPRTVKAVQEWKALGKRVPKKIFIPERSFLRSTIDDKKTKIRKFVIALVAASFKKNDVNIVKILNLIGFKVVSEVQLKITKGDDDWPKNSPFTIFRKGSTKPLLDTGRMRQSISHELDK